MLYACDQRPRKIGSVQGCPRLPEPLGRRRNVRELLAVVLIARLSNCAQMNLKDIGKRIERYLTSADDVVKAYTLGSGASARARVTGAVEAYRRCNSDLNGEMRRVGRGAESGGEASFAKACLDAYQTVHVYPKIESLFKMVREQAAIAASSDNLDKRWVELLGPVTKSSQGPARTLSRPSTAVPYSPVCTYNACLDSLSLQPLPQPLLPTHPTRPLPNSTCHARPWPPSGAAP